MKKTTILLLTLLLISCSSKNQNKTVKPLIKKTKQEFVDYNVGLKFINDYTELCNEQMTNRDTIIDIRNWINKNKIVSVEFKKRYNFILDSAEQASPETGLDFDPIFDAQDYTDSIFEIKEIDSLNNFIKVIGKGDNFKSILRVVKYKNKTLVDGAGIINIPKNKQRK